MVGWMYYLSKEGWMDGQIRREDGWMDVLFIKRRMVGWTDEERRWVDGCITYPEKDGWMDVCMNG